MECIIFFIRFSLNLFTKWPATGHFGWPTITFNRISRHFRSMRNFLFFWKFFTKWPTAAILDDWPRRRRLFWITENQCQSHFSPFQSNTQLFFLNFVRKMAAGGHFGWPKITFDRISRHFRSIRNFNFVGKFYKMAGGGHFRLPQNHFWSHFSPFQINTQLFFFWMTLSIAFLAISDQYATFILFFILFTKWPPVAILDDRKSLLIAFLAISDQYAT